ncbi:MAG: tetratricopeptide repeat protein [candidate division Zixibacteria bacterium]|nr:tetratricopeptide repeat protein [candidate division Zixibacteria bacterium]
MKKTPVTIIILALLTLGCAGSTVRRQTAEVKPANAEIKTYAVSRPQSKKSRINTRALEHFVNGVFFEQVGDLPAAAASYKNALQIYPDSYEIRYSMAMVYYMMRRYEDVLTILELIEPEDAQVYSLRGSCFHALRQADSARAAYLQVVRLDSQDTQAYSFLAGSYRNLHLADSAIWAYENLARLHPYNYRLRQELARLQAEAGRFDDAKDSYWASIETASDSTNLLSFVGLGEIYRISGQLDSALIVFRAGFETNSDNIVINRELTSLYADLDSLEQALTHARKVVTLAPRDRFAIRRLGSIYLLMDSLTVADSIFAFLVQSGERNPVNHMLLGRIAMLQERYPDAVEQFTVWTELADTAADAWLNLAFACRQSGDIDREILTYRTGLNHMADETSAVRLLFALGASYEQNGHFDEAVATFEQIIANSPDHSPSLNYLGYMLADRGERLEYARQLTEKAVATSPDNAAYLDSYGWVFYRLGDYKRALTYLRKSVSLDNDPVIFDHLGDACKATGNIEEARTWWRKALELEPDNQAIKEKLGL